MAKQKEGFFTIVSRGASAIAENSFLALAAVLSFALLDALILQSLAAFFGITDFATIQNLGAMGKNALLLQFVGAFSLMSLLKILIFGPLFAATAVYISRGYAYDKKTSFSGAINFVLSRYKRLFFPYLKAQLSIQFGMIILIPGILFLMQFAFVDAIACTEDEEHVLSRSKRLTRGRRRSLFLLLLPWALGMQVIGLFALMFAQNMVSLTLINTTMEMLYFFMLCSFFMLYEQRMSLLAARRAQKQEQPEPVRIILNRQNGSSLGSGLLVLAVFYGGALMFLSQHYNKIQYASCVRTTTEKQIESIAKLKADKGLAQSDLQSACEKAKGQCLPPSKQDPCTVLCNSAIQKVDINELVIADDCQ